MIFQCWVQKVTEIRLKQAALEIIYILYFEYCSKISCSYFLIALELHFTLSWHLSFLLWRPIGLSSIYVICASWLTPAGQEVEKQKSNLFVLFLFPTNGAPWKSTNTLCRCFRAVSNPVYHILALTCILCLPSTKRSLLLSLLCVCHPCTTTTFFKWVTESKQKENRGLYSHSSTLPDATPQWSRDRDQKHKVFFILIY